MDDAAKALFDKAFAIFLVDERDNILNDIAEQNLAANLGYIIRDHKADYGFSVYRVDPEYNRMQDDRRVKLILDEDMVEVPIRADLLLHGRGTQGPRENIIAIEMKKAGRPAEETINDQRRLRALTTPPSNDRIWSADGKTFPEYVCGYELGIFIELDTQRALYRRGVSRWDAREYDGRRFLTPRFQ